ncbi:hypothetical protein HMPREF2758_01990 [Facklamia sp. HMSC062C11]|uniref:helix-turn-helix domain-containing protein n=1 Tax=Facklamia sp. HMSC062C11 TaxID=1739262 RepID=UPI0008A3D806|nr:helix-turn-helix domain-containing protein [Facklamia sp. HMSC062C11]OFL65619.1 hypothetical protein HMPREF2758_01990 [Facklamia sp. HMSC062C11]
MSKRYSYKFKMRVVEEYFEGKLGYRTLANKYNISTESLVRQWVNNYKDCGKNSLKSREGKTKYPLEFKLNVLHYKQETGASYRETAKKFGLNNPSLIANWRRAYLEGGANQLNNPIGRPSDMHKKPKLSKKSQRMNLSEKEELELLRQEVTYLKIENLYLKKLKELGLKDHRDPNRPNSL